MVNRVMLIGNLGRDPEIRRLENGAAVAKFTLATNESYKDRSGQWQDSTEWHNIVLWRGLAERAESSLRKGSLVYLEGKLTHRSYQDKDGNTRYVTEVVGNYFRMIPQGRDGQGASRVSTEVNSHAPAESDSVPHSSEADAPPPS